MLLKFLKSALTVMLFNFCFIMNVFANGSHTSSLHTSAMHLVTMSPVANDDVEKNTQPLKSYMRQQPEEGIDENGVQNIFKKSDFIGNRLRRYPTPIEKQRLVHQKLVPQKNAARDSNSSLTKQETQEEINPEYEDMAAAFDPNDLKCMTQILYHEARGETYSAAVAVGNVVINRMNNKEFPKTVCGVMKQKSGASCQFSFVCNGRLKDVSDKTSWVRSEKIAKQVLSGNAPNHGGNALFFHSANVNPGWFKKLGKGTRIGSHYFYD